MSLRSLIVSQFKRPHGLLGRLAGYTMANQPSNRQRSKWTVGLLALEPRHRVIEIGCGPGLALKACATILTEGYVVGIDHSEVMVSQARRRLAAEIEAGRAEVRLGTLVDPGMERDAYDRVFSVNVIQFFPDMDDAFRKIRGCLSGGGIVATTYQPRSRNPTRERAFEMADKIEAAMRAAGFERAERHELPMEPVPAICVTGAKA